MHWIIVNKVFSTRFAQRQFETCFKNTCFSKRHTVPISNIFHRHMFQNGTQYVHSFNKYKKHLLLSAENNSTLNKVIKLQIHLLSNHYLVDRQAIKVTTLLLPILHMSTTQLIGNNKQPTSKSTKYRRYHSAHQGSGRIQTKQPNPTPFRTPPNHQQTKPANPQHY